MPVYIDILENKVLGREYRRGFEEGRREGREEGRREGKLEFLHDQIQDRFGVLPEWAEKRLAALSAAEIHRTAIRWLTAETLADLFA